MPDIPKYDGTTDPQKHVTLYTCTIKGNDVEEDEIESVLLKKFGETLSKKALTWYDHLPEHSITSFEMLADAFIKVHAGAKKNSDKSRRNFEPEIRSSKDRYRLYAQPERSSFRSNKGRNGPSHPSSRGDRRNDRGSTSRGLLFRGDTSGSANNGDIPRLSEYNFNINATDLVLDIGHIKDARWPRPLRSDPSQRDPSVICEYHGTHGHRTKDCRQLREEVARLLKNGHLREFLSERAKGHYKDRENHKQVEPMEPQHVINMIIGGTDRPRGPVMKRTKVSIVREKRTGDYVPEGSISFNDEDEEGSSANIIQWRVVEQLGLLDQIVPVARVLSGFNMASETTKGEIFLPVNIDGTI
ncbi:uncharacterized protein LOC132034687 [Lycium ferocissimum]|uniref:uncharacterized protein LOC132034687 n=1 Tax=Lycium ferocissimum TaxID=112874 RepID=UPI0028164145|nr:uncharacterized protein LOC132034687 [Lycium ferocissimum]